MGGGGGRSAGGASVSSIRGGYGNQLYVGDGTTSAYAPSPSYRSGYASVDEYYAGVPRYSTPSPYTYVNGVAHAPACVDLADWKDPDGDVCAEYAMNTHWCNWLIFGSNGMTPRKACCQACSATGAVDTDHKEKDGKDLFHH
uniref:Uncharacterized protein n=1 Tax=Chromera velia CCMP2878 TaxID=1169474 RepID=A0A0G4H4E9_9ALVE|mmetsp:Transcript_5587/g.11072  ORF Transcript_5587/g.11072 Transcript_5587/m.11072 type:complete len:142 (+) Transcript_5587:147-572(+)|eukprot:Cvel_24665.t1-p1 / transcript=Cvel_24665.t1 / gene=Cvel_24665 / organism=Chromera_velia_CCMP2878 / gene_product=hypothetical protein / transcript_product=hypothetical protein / location=Cvel_scaffold2698:19499-20003(+) / protein_length=141 / sequence_SO=supercontig / SO=protein_coding / is_pseudo=false